jgi:Tol biopolymer transport system component
VEIATTTTLLGNDQLGGLAGVLAYVFDSTEVAKVWSMELNGDDQRVLAEFAVDQFLDVVPSSRRELLAVVDRENHAVVLNGSGDTVFRSVSKVAGHVFWASGGGHLAFRDSEYRVVLADIDTGAEIRPLPDVEAGRMVWSPTADLLWIWRASDGSYLVTSEGEVRGQFPAYSRSSSSRDLAVWSPIGDRILVTTVSFDGSTALAMIHGDGTVVDLDGPPGEIVEIAVSVDGRVAAYRVTDPENESEFTRLVNLDSAQVIAELPIGGSMNWTDQGLGVASSDRSWLVSADGVIKAEAGFAGLEIDEGAIWWENRFARFGRSGIVVGDAGASAVQWSSTPLEGVSQFLDDGRAVLFTASLDGNHNKETYIATAEGETPLTEYEGDDLSPVLMGSRLYFISDRGGDRQIELLDMETSEILTLSDTPLPASSISLSPDGDTLGVRGVDGWTPALFEIDLATGQAAELIGPPESVFELAEGEEPPPHFGIGAMGRPIWSPDQSRFAVPTNAGPAVLTDGELKIPADYEALISGYEAILTDMGILETIEFHNVLPLCPETVAWSPDGETLAFVFPCIALYPAGIWTVDANGGVPELVMAPVTNVTDLGWSQIENEIVVAHQDIDTEQAELTLISVDGRQTEVVSQNATSPVWSPDGSRLAYTVASPTGPTIFVREHGEASTILELVGDDYSQVELRWSPDGGYLAYGRSEPWFLALAGTRRTNHCLRLGLERHIAGLGHSGTFLLRADRHPVLESTDRTKANGTRSVDRPAANA